MNSQTKKDIPCFRSYLPDALRLRFEDKLTIRAIAQRLGLSHSTIHTLFQRFIASGIAWPLPDSVSLAQLDAIIRFFSDLLHPVSHGHCPIQFH